eukprot:77922_1
MSNPSSLFGSITDEKTKRKSKLVSISKQQKHQNQMNQKKFNYESNAMKKCNLFGGYSEILFNIFPSIFMPYLDVETFLSLLKTDLWNWYHLLSNSIVFDYCNYISIRHKEQIEQFCHNCDSEYNSSDSMDSFDYYNENENYSEQQNYTFHLINNSKYEEQNFAILRLSSKQKIEVNNLFILNIFDDIDIIYDRMSLIPAMDIGLTTNLCKNVTIENNKYKKYKNNKKNIIFVYDTFDEMQNDLEINCYYNKKDLTHIKKLLITDILNICVDKWYFVEWREIKHKYVENNQIFQIVNIKQMIIGHFKSTKYSKYMKQKNNQLFVAWSLEWQSTQQQY